MVYQTPNSRRRCWFGRAGPLKGDLKPERNMLVAVTPNKEESYGLARRPKRRCWLANPDPLKKMFGRCWSVNHEPLKKLLVGKP